MKQIIISLLVYIVLTGNESCVKSASDCVNKTVASEQSDILNYASSHGITGTLHSSGLYYQIITGGGGPVPVSSSKISVTYTGKLINDNVFDTQSSPVQLTLSDAIQGWQIGLPFIHKGGRIILIIPSSLAYGCRGFGAVPGDAILVFDITLVDVQ